MKILSLQAFVPSGPDFDSSVQLFQDLGFSIKWNAGDYIGFDKDGCGFILQRYNNIQFAENLMLTVAVSSADEVWKEIKEKALEEKYRIRLGAPADMPYGREVNMIDIAGVCWHFVQST
jgi:hypothetical protein